MNLKKTGKVLRSKSVGTGPSSYEKRIYRVTVSQRLRNTGIYNYVAPLCFYTPVKDSLDLTENPARFSKSFHYTYITVYSNFTGRGS